MIISERYKFIFFEVGKTGTQSTSAVLRIHGKVENGRASPVLGLSDEERFLYGPHMPPVRLQESVSADRFETYFRFAFVRNPFDRLVSRYLYSGLAQLRRLERGIACPMTLQDVQLLCRYPRLGFVLRNGGRIDKYFQFRSLSWLDYDTQIGFLSKHNGTLLVDFVGRFECLQHDFNEACKLIGLQQQALPWLNRTQHDHYSIYYTEETRNYVSNALRQDLEHFNYTFDSR